VYTHGYGIDSATANAHTGNQPTYLLSDIPTRAATGAPPLTQPDVYFGQGLNGYSVVDSKVQEQEANGEATASTTQYSGTGGVKVKNFVRRLAFALRFGDFNLVYSGQVTTGSRILYLRDIEARVRTAAPFLQWDADPYAVNLNGKIVWVLDGYTSTNQYPYSQSINANVPQGSGLNTNLNYVRNSVKATVDAYDGTIHFYVVDPSDPIIRTYEKAFPDLFNNVNTMPPGLRDHWRYPQDIFDVQTEQYTQYHMTNTQQFFQKAALWDVAPSPDAIGTGTAAATVAPIGGANGGRNSTLSGSGNPIDPLYLMMHLPNETGQEFVLERPFVPIRKANQLSSFMVARNDGANYGKLILYQAPDQSNAVSPARAASLIEADPNISAKFSLLDQLGSKVVRGSAQLIPMDGSIFYVRPIYVEGSGSSPLPRFNYVAVTYGERAVLDLNVPDAVGHLLDGTIPPVELTGNTQPVSGPNGNTVTTTTTPNSTPGTTAVTTPPNATVAQLVAAANALSIRANQALANQDLTTYAKDIKQVQDLLAQADALLGHTAPTTTVPISPPSSTTPSTTTKPKPGSTSTTVAKA
jgi:uncharacterized membrane protein (UPF0182 family)